MIFSLLYNLLFTLDKSKYNIKYYYNEIIIKPLITIIGQGSEKINYFSILIIKGKIRINVYGIWQGKKNNECSYYYEPKNSDDLLKIINNDFLYKF